MAKIFITYGDQNFSNSKWLVGQQARKLGIFDRVKVYGPKDLPLGAKALPLYVFFRGFMRGGAQSSKPYIIWDAMRHAEVGDVIYYADSGCRLQPSDEWEKYDELMKTYNGIFFNYRRDHDYHWERWGHNSVEIKHWTKPTALEYFGQYFPDEKYKEIESLMSGFLIAKKTERMQWLDDWMQISFLRQDLLNDPFGPEKVMLPETYAAHRHDQSFLTFLVNYYKEKENLLILPETSESDMEHAAVAAVRYRVGKLPLLKTIKFRLYHLRKLSKM